MASSSIKPWRVFPQDGDYIPELDCVAPTQFQSHSETCSARPGDQTPESTLNRSATNGCLLCALWLRALRATSEHWGNPISLYAGVNPFACKKLGEYASRIRENFDIFTDMENPIRVAGIAQQRFPSDDTGSVAALAFVKAQLDNCLETHKFCGGGSKTRLPTRVIDISDHLIVRLKETSDGFAHYAALSHCWGDNLTLKTTSATLRSYCDEIPHGVIPRTFLDAIDFCRKIGLSYIWIDSLCIVQDSRSDWQRESALMADIYSNAYITVAATASSDSNGGCYRKRRDHVERIAQVQDGHSIVNVYARRAWPHFSREGLHGWPLPDSLPQLLQRAWVFQERLLSARVVHFTAHEIMWECRETESCECLCNPSNARNEFGRMVKFASHRRLPLKRDLLLFTVSNTGKLSDTTWAQIVEKYTDLNLTYATDILPALSGIAKSVSHLNLGNYYAGLWERDLRKSLCWVSIPAGGPRPGNHCPSWSWSSVSTPVHFCSGASIEDSIISVQCDLVGRDPFGEVHGGKIVLLTELLLAEPVSAKLWNAVHMHLHKSAHPVNIVMNGIAYVVAWDTDDCCRWPCGDSLHCPRDDAVVSSCASTGSPQTLLPTSNPELFCMHIPTRHGFSEFLVLERERSHENVFRRVGYIADPSRDIDAGKLRFLAESNPRVAWSMRNRAESIITII